MPFLGFMRTVQGFIRRFMQFVAGLQRPAFEDHGLANWPWRRVYRIGRGTVSTALSGLHFSNALWVKSGNRRNLICLKVNNNFALIFQRKIFISFLSDAKLPKVYD